MLTRTPSSARTPTDAPAIRVAHLALELLVSATISFLITSVLLRLRRLPFFGLVFHFGCMGWKGVEEPPDPLTVFCVTAICTLVVYAGIKGVLQLFRRWRRSADSLRVNGGEKENPTFKLTPRVRDADVEEGPCEKA
ncbi:hypothetical protein B0H11DRAFT_318118 [Mycena galericulata]|nr:hypothetical protein B0H11DRAFT_318118 [Mycena galericulata]